MTKCGLHIISDTLQPVRESVVLSMIRRGEYGRVEDWSGSVIIEVMDSCILGRSLQELVGTYLADQTIEYGIAITDWQIDRVENLLTLRPREWIEVGVDD